MSAKHPPQNFWPEIDNDSSTIRECMLKHMVRTISREPSVAHDFEWYNALAHTIRDRVQQRMIKTGQYYKRHHDRTVAYLSAEFLLGPHLGNNILALGIHDQVQEAVESLGLDLDTLLQQEAEPGLGNGGLGRLAACYMDSMATKGIPAIGYGIRYQFGIFRQEIVDGWQMEKTDKWLRYGNPWETVRPHIAFKVHFGGHTEHARDHHGNLVVHWHGERRVMGVAYDTPICGYGVTNANLLRLWRCEASESFDFQAFNTGDYYGAVDEKIKSENITKVLYPNDEAAAGKQLRLEQQYFFVSCSLQDMIRIHLRSGEALETFHEKFAAQLNDTHPAVAIPELMRLLVDDHAMPWDDAWEVTRQTFAYTNHTLLPEALEKWSLELFARLLPRHLEIVQEIDRRFLAEMRTRLHTINGESSRLSIIEYDYEPRIRMAHLASVGSYAINGVAELHTDLLKKRVLHDFDALWPDKIVNVTNGVTPRRFMALCNPGMANLLNESIGESWITDLDQLKKLEAFADDAAFQERWIAVKQANKQRVSACIEHVNADPCSLFDVQVKRIHEYKRQHLNLLHIITMYNRLKEGVGADMPARTFIFGGKAAPGYFMAKLIIKAINSVADVINSDPDMEGKLNVAFLPDYNVKTAHTILPSADLSEQISLAGKEASGTGNMKMALNGALTIGTHDGANIEIHDEVGAENFFSFGLKEEEVIKLQHNGYLPSQYVARDTELKDALDFLAGGYFSQGDKDLFRPLVDNLLHHDPYKVLADYRSYVDCQQTVSETFADTSRWAKMSILNVARMGKFSSDRSIQDYCDRIWKVGPVVVE